MNRQLKTIGTFVLMSVAFLFTSFYILIFLGTSLSPWDGYVTNSPARPSLETVEGRLNSYFESGNGDYILLTIVVISLLVIITRFAIKREPLDQLFLNTAAAYVFYLILSFIGILFIALFRSTETGYDPVQITMHIITIIALFILQYEVNLTSNNRRKISNLAH